MSNIQMSNSRELTNISKTLSYILRHGAEKENIPISSDGYVLLSDLQSHKLFKSIKNNFTDVIESLVKEDKKQRYKLDCDSQGNQRIRANQGHSIALQDELALLTRLTSPLPTAIHGTYSKYLPTILASGGLSRMSRSHIHLAPAEKEHKPQSGYRSDCDVLIYIDVHGAMSDGIEFYRSENGVILTKGIDGFLSPKYFKEIKHI